MAYIYFAFLLILIVTNRYYVRCCSVNIRQRDSSEMLLGRKLERSISGGDLALDPFATNILQFTTNHIRCIHYFADIFSIVVVFEDFEFASSFVYNFRIDSESFYRQNRPARAPFCCLTKFITIII